HPRRAEAETLRLARARAERPRVARGLPVRQIRVTAGAIARCGRARIHSPHPGRRGRRHPARGGTARHFSQELVGKAQEAWVAQIQLRPRGAELIPFTLPDGNETAGRRTARSPPALLTRCDSCSCTQGRSACGLHLPSPTCKPVCSCLAASSWP